MTIFNSYVSLPGGKWTLNDFNMFGGAWNHQSGQVLETRMNQQQMLQDQSSSKQSNQQAQIECRTSGLISTFSNLRKLFKKLRLRQWIKHPAAVVSRGITWYAPEACW